MWTPTRALVKPAATTAMETEVGDCCVKVTVADLAGELTIGNGLVTNCLSQRLGIETETETAVALAPKLEPSTVMVCGEAANCAADTRETVVAPGGCAGAGTKVKVGNVKVFTIPCTVNSNAIPTTS